MIEKLKKMISRFLLNDKNIKRNVFFWNAFSAVMNSFQTMLLLLIITRMGNETDSSIFVMAYAVGNLVLNVGKYGVRQYQVTDINEQCRFKDYLKARYTSMVFMFVSIFSYLLYHWIRNDYTTEKSVVVLVICLVKAVEAFEDVYHGRMQQKGRLDVAGRILGVRLCIFIIGYGIMYIVTENLMLTSIVNLMATIIISIILNSMAFKAFKDESGAEVTGGVKKIIIECLPLCLCMCLNMYIANAPKYTIDTAVSDEVQTKFNIVFMPVFIIALLATFIFQPFLKRMGEMWVKNEIGKLKNTIIKFTFIIIVIDAIITFVGSFIGNPILGAIYGVDLSRYDSYLIIFMIAGGVIALQNLFIMVITTVRYQKYMIYGYIVTALFMVLLGKIILDRGGLISLCLFFLGMLVFLTLYCIGLIIVAINNRKRNGADE